MKHVRKRLTYANVMSSIAVFLVLGGGAAVAAGLAKNSVGTPQIKRNAVKVGKLAPEAVKAGKLAKNAVPTNRLRDNAVSAEKIASGSILTDKLADESVTSGKLAKDSVLTDKILNSAVTGEKLATNSVSTGKIVNSAVTTEKIAGDAVTAGKLGPVVLRQSAANPVAANSIGSASVSCLAGEEVLSGGSDVSSSNLAIAEFRKSGNGWFVTGRNNTAAQQTLQAEVLCLAP